MGLLSFAAYDAISNDDFLRRKATNRTVHGFVSVFFPGFLVGGFWVLFSLF